MIETRYDIEYIDPNGKPTVELGRFFAYLLLLITLLIFLATLVFSNLSESTSQLVIQRIQEFTGIKSNTITTYNDDERSAEIAEEAKLADQKALAAAKDENEKNIKEIERLSQENTQQSQTLKQQQLENQHLTEDLERISQQLAEEKKAHDQLANHIETLNNKNSALSKQLADSKKIKIKKVPTVSSTLKKTEPEIAKEEEETPKADSIEKTDKLKEKNVKTEEPAKPKPVVATQQNTISTRKDANKTSTEPKKQETPLSQMDAIVKAMEAAKQ